MANINEILSQYYYNIEEPSSYGSIKKLYKAAKNDVIEIKYKDIINWLLKQKTYGVHRYSKYKFKRNPIVSRNIDHIWNADLMEIPPPYQQHNSGFKYILVAIDNLSKYGWAHPLKDKTGRTVKQGFLRILTSNRRKPKLLFTDAGREFTSIEFRNMCSWRNIKLAIVHDSTKAVLAERWIRTLKEKINKYMTYNNTMRFIDQLQNIVKGYNNSIHSRTKFKPIDVDLRTERAAYRNLYKNRISRQKNKLNIGDRVRVALLRNVFDKGYKPIYSDRVYKIYQIYFTSPYYKYRVKELSGRIVKGSYYETELLKIVI